MDGVKKMNETEDYQNIKKAFEDDFQALFKIMNISVPLESSLETAFYAYDNFQISLFNNRPIPEIPDKLWKNLTFIYNVYFYLTFFKTEDQQKLTSSSIFRDFTRYFRKI